MSDTLIDGLLLGEVALFAGVEPKLHELWGAECTASNLLDHLSSLKDRAYVALLQSEVLISHTDINRLVISLDQNSTDIAAVPLTVAPDLSLVNPPTTPSGSSLAAWGDADHPDYNVRRKVSVRGAAIVLFRREPLLQILGSMKGREGVDLDRLLNVASSSNGAFLVAGAAARVLPKGDGLTQKATLRARRNSRTCRSILYVDSTIPQPDKDAGSDTAWRVLHIMRELDFQVTFIPAYVGDGHRKYIDSVRNLGVKVICPPYVRNIADYIRDTDETFDVAFLSRAPVVSSLFEPVRAKWPNCLLIFNTVDIHYLRMFREAIVHSNPDLFTQAVSMKQVELSLIERADKTLVLSEAELDILREEGIKAPVIVVPPVYDAAKLYPYEPATRAGVCFIGGYAHLPNVDAVEYFVSEVWPLVTANRSDIVFYIVGANAPSHFAAYESNNVKVVGFVEDLDEFLSGMRLMVSPLRYGAGVKVKVIASLSAGVPAVVTSVSVEGAGIQSGEGCRIADSKEALASEILALYDDFDALLKLSNRGRSAVNARYSIENLRSKYRELLCAEELMESS